MKKHSALLWSLCAALAGLIMLASTVGIVDYEFKTQGDNAAAFLFFMMPWGLLLHLGLWGGIALIVGGLCSSIVVLTQRLSKKNPS
jgi:hypothetical protein